jgi:hypothetical protein
MATKTEWWYDDCTYHYSGNSEIVLARLIVRNDGTAQLLTEGGEVREFPNEDEASCWLVDEEYEPFETLIEDFAERGVLLDPRIKVPTATTLEDLIPQMVIKLQPGENSVAGGTPTPAHHGSANARSNPHVD